MSEIDIPKMVCKLLGTKFTGHIMHRACALSSKVNNNRANGHCVDLTILDVR